MNAVLFDLIRRGGRAVPNRLPGAAGPRCALAVPEGEDGTHI
jgi:hypothetical protein